MASAITHQRTTAQPPHQRIRVPSALLPSKPPALPHFPQPLQPMREKITDAILTSTTAIPSISNALHKGLEEIQWRENVGDIVLERVRSGIGGKRKRAPLDEGESERGKRLKKEQETREAVEVRIVKDVMRMVRAGIKEELKGMRDEKRKNTGFGLVYSSASEGESSSLDEEVDGAEDGGVVGLEERKRREERRKRDVVKVKIPTSALNMAAEVVKRELERTCVVVDEDEDEESEVG